MYLLGITFRKLALFHLQFICFQYTDKYLHVLFFIIEAIIEIEPRTFLNYLLFQWLTISFFENMKEFRWNLLLDIFDQDVCQEIFILVHIGGG
jgi:hypothetical protein